MEEAMFTTRRLDHLGIVTGLCQEIDLIAQIDAQVGPTDRKVSVGQAVQAMVLNALGFVGRPLYLTPEFFSNKPVDLLIGGGLTPQDFNDDSLGRALDKLYDAGLTEGFAKVACHALEVFGIAHQFVHLDSSSFSLKGEYATSSEDPQAVTITHGYSKDHRPDLKQVVVSMICSYRSSIPVWLEALDGNRVDKKSFPSTIKAYIEQLSGEDLPYFIVDSALYSKDNLQTLSATRWISRVPGTIKAVQQLYQAISPQQMESASQEGYLYMEVGNWYGGVKQRWLVVFSQAAYKREQATFQKQLEKEHAQAEAALRKLSSKEFDDNESAQASVDALVQSWSFHTVDAHFLEVPHYARPGRPKQGGKPKRVGFRVGGQIVEQRDAIEQALATKGKFVLATNELEEEQLPTETILTAYKGQGASVERGFRFLKDPLFFASSLFLEKPERIMALLMVMGLSLLIYALGEHKLRTQLAARKQTLPNQVGQPTQRPTLRRIFQVFEGIDLLLIHHPATTQGQVLNLKPIHRRILELLGPQVQKYYIPDG